MEANKNNNTTKRMEREDIIDLAFQQLEKKNLDEMSIIQLRNEMQLSLEEQITTIFHSFENVDKSLPLPNDDTITDGAAEDDVATTTHEHDEAIFETILKEELDYIKQEMVATDPTTTKQHAPKGLDPKIFLEMKKGAIETLLSKKQTTTEGAKTSNTGGDDDSNESSSTSSSSSSSWIEADNFGYHESIIDDEMNNEIRYHQTINICRSALLRKELGYSIIALKSCIPGAGRGVYVDGFVKAGTIVAFQPGLVYPKEYILTMPYEEEKLLQNNDNYQISLRHDDHLIDSRKSPYTVLTNENSNSMALGHVVNHPTSTKPPNCQSIMLNFFIKDMKINGKYIPNVYAKPPTLTVMGGLWDKQAIDMHGMCLIATRDICNEELFYDYRLMTSHVPTWYTPVEDTYFTGNDESEGGEGGGEEQQQEGEELEEVVVEKEEGTKNKQ